MNKIVTILLAMVLAATIPYHATAWGKKGHNLVAEIAFSRLDENTKQAVQKYLGTTTIEEASTWMDDVRSDHQYDYMKSWHYVNIAKGSQYTPTQGGNVINELEKAITALEHKSTLTDEEIKKNLLILFHLVGDFHQPLHLGYEDDKGGNTIKVTYKGSKTNLHTVWDTKIIESENITLDDCLSQLKTLNKQEIAQLKNTNVESWIPEPRALLANVYDFKDDTIDEKYAAKNKPVIERQLLIAGIKLAAVLEKVFKA